MITFPDTSVVGDTACATVIIIDDSTLERDEDFLFQITSPTDPPGLTIIIPSSTTVVTIEDNEGRSSAQSQFTASLGDCNKHLDCVPVSHL